MRNSQLLTVKSVLSHGTLDDSLLYLLPQALNSNRTKLLIWKHFDYGFELATQLLSLNFWWLTQKLACYYYFPLLKNCQKFIELNLEVRNTTYYAIMFAQKRRPSSHPSPRLCGIKALYEKRNIDPFIEQQAAGFPMSGNVHSASQNDTLWTDFQKSTLRKMVIRIDDIQRL